MHQRLKGYLITFLGVLIITPDALLLRLIESGPMTIMVWRGLGFALILWMLVIWRYGRNAFAALQRTGSAGCVIAVATALGQLLFVYSIHHTHVANTLVIVAAVPLATGGLARLWLGEPMAPRTLVTGVFVVLAVMLTMAGGFAVQGTSGDVAAIGAVICLAILFTAIRKVSGRDILPAIACSGVISAGIAFFLAPTIEVARGDLGMLAVLCLFVSPVSFALISLGPRYLPAAEVALLLLLETALGPVWVWLFLGEQPTGLTLVGGGIMIAALAINSWLLLSATPIRVPFEKNFRDK